MRNSKAVAALHPLLSSAKWLSFVGGFVLFAVWIIQASSDIPARMSFSPVELSSNVIATMGLAWALLQVRTPRRNADVRRAWGLFAAGMALLSVEGNVGDLMLMRTHEPDEMGLSIGLWLLAAALIFRGGRVFAPRRSVMAMLWLGFLIQVISQYLGWLGALEQSDVGAAEALEYLNDMGELTAVLAYLAAMLLAEFAPIKSYRFPKAAIGRRSREIVRDFRLLETARFPIRNRWLSHWSVRWLTILAILGWHLVRVAPRVARDGGRSVAGQAFDLARFGFRGVNPHSYYLLELFRPANRARADEFMTRVETKNGLTKALHPHVRHPKLHSEMNDKLVFTAICQEAGLPVAPILADAGEGRVAAYADDAEFDRDLLVKERKSRGGKLTLVFRRVESLVYRDEQGELIGLDQLMTKLALGWPGRRLIVQPKLKNHDSVSFLADDALVVFRAVTCLDGSGAPHLTHGLVRIMRRFEPNWPSFPEKEWGAAIDLETGEVGPLAGDAPATCANWYPDHPVNGRAVEGVVLSEWSRVADVALRAHRVFAGRAVVGWDIALTPEGPQILEGNSNMDFNFIQRCYRTPVGRSPLAALMQPYLDAALAAEERRFTM